MPGLAVIVAIIQDDKVLLTKREDFEVWCLPGGSVEEGESLAEAGVREAREETGLEVELMRLIGVYSRLGGGMNDVHAVLFRAKPLKGELKTQSGETLEVAYFPFDELPDEMLFGHQQRSADAIRDISGVVMKQELNIQNDTKLSRKELYEMRDNSGLSRQEFYRDRIRQAKIAEIVEIDFSTPPYTK